MPSPRIVPLCGSVSSMARESGAKNGILSFKGLSETPLCLGRIEASATKAVR